MFYVIAGVILISNLIFVVLAESEQAEWTKKPVAPTPKVYSVSIGKISEEIR